MYAEFRRIVQLIRENDYATTWLEASEDDIWIQYMTHENWEELGRDMSNNTRLEKVKLHNDALNDQKMTSLFRGLTRSSSIDELHLWDNELSVAAVRSMVPFLQNANNLYSLNLDDNDLQSEGFNLLLRALCDSPIRRLDCCNCGIESIEIDSENKPKHLKQLYLEDNLINAAGCREIAKLLRGEDSTLKELHLDDNQIDDDGVEILVDALQRNTSLKNIYLGGNNKISKQGQLMLLKLVSDVSSIEATLQSNHTLNEIQIIYGTSGTEDARIISEAINLALENTSKSLDDCFDRNSLERAKVIHTQLYSAIRAKLASILGVTSSVFSEIDPLHLPEVLALVGRHHGQGELYIALKSSITGVISTVNRKECLKQRIAEQRAIMVECRTNIEAAEAEIAAIEAAEVHVLDAVSDDSRSNKRRRS